MAGSPSARFYPQLISTAVIIGLVYPIFEGIAWSHHFGIQHWLQAIFSAEFRDFAGSIVVHAVSGWIALPAVLLLGVRRGRYTKDGAISAHRPSGIPFLALGAWILIVGWFGLNVMSAQTMDQMDGCSGQLVDGNGWRYVSGLDCWQSDPGYVHNRPLAGLVAICAGANDMHPMGALITGVIAGVIFAKMFAFTQNKWKIDDVLSVRPLHGLCGTWGGLAVGIFGSKALCAIGGVSFF